MNRPLIVDAENLAVGPRSWLAERAEIVSVGPEDGDRWTESLARASALVVRTYVRVDAALLDLAPNLRVVGRAGVGLDSIDVKACRARGIEVVYTPEANASTVAELVFGLLLDVLRPRPLLTGELTKAEWVEARNDHLGDRELAGMTLGVWGLGRVGSKIARAGRGFSMGVLYHDLRDIPEGEREGAEPVDRDTMLSEADVISIHVDGRPENRGLVDTGALERMKEDAVLVNAARGFVLDSMAVRGWLDAHPDARAICDVHDREPVPHDHPLLGHPRAALTAHLGAGTRPAKDRMGRVVEDVWRVLLGEPPRWSAPQG